jgi:dihydroxy-acid dehydratase
MSDKDDLRKYSSQVVDGVERTPGRAMLRAVGFTDEDFKKPQIGIASTWAMVTPCNMHIDKLAIEAEKAQMPPEPRVSFSTPSPFPTASPTAPKA